MSVHVAFGSVLQTSNAWLLAMNNQAIIAAANAAILVDTSDESRKKRKGAEGASALPHDIHPNDLLNVLIRDHLFFKQEAQPVVDAQGFQGSQCGKEVCTISFLVA